MKCQQCGRSSSMTHRIRDGKIVCQICTGEIQPVVTLGTRVQAALSAWASWYSDKLDRINATVSARAALGGSDLVEDYSPAEQDLYESVGCSPQPFVLDYLLVIRVTRVQVVRNGLGGCDHVFLSFDGPLTSVDPQVSEPHPADNAPSFKVDVARGYAPEWLKKMGIDPSRIEILEV